MKKFVIQAIILIIVIFGALYFNSTHTPGLLNLRQKPAPIQSSTKGQLVISGTTINIETADTTQRRSLGLGGRDTLATDSGMLFTFPDQAKHSFWMKGMRFALDFIWIRKMKVVDILKNAQPPQPGQADETLPVYVPNQPVDSVLEVNAGFVDSHGIKVGDIVDIR